MGELGEFPVIRRALGDGWHRLDPAVRAHYDITPGRWVMLEGTMHRIDHAPLAIPLLVAGRLLKALPCRRGSSVPVAVCNWADDREPDVLRWHRRFHFPGKGEMVFDSRMVYAGGSEVIEYVRGGLGIRMRVTVDDGSLVFRGTCFRWDVSRISLPLPEWLMPGKAVIRESGISDTEFEMDFRMRHPMLGPTFTYSGRFAIVDRSA